MNLQKYKWTIWCLNGNSASYLSAEIITGTDAKKVMKNMNQGQSYQLNCNVTCEKIANWDMTDFVPFWPFNPHINLYKAEICTYYTILRYLLKYVDIWPCMPILGILFLAIAQPF